MEERSLNRQVKIDLSKKMVFLAGPRQAGKTTFAKGLLNAISGTYYNYDNDHDRAQLLHSRLDASSRLWIFDEIHKYTRWRNWLKGIFDEHREDHQILVTGSAKLDIYRRGGDSLQGRYYLFRFHPFTVGELIGNIEFWSKPEDMIREMVVTPSLHKSAQEVLQSLLQYGPFPEPFTSASDVESARWRIGYSRRVIREEIASLENLKDLSQLELLFDHLPNTVGSPLSLNSLREDLEVSHESVRKWLEIFERLFLIHRVSPFGPAKIKAVKKEQKLYLWDWTYIDEPGPRLENLVASHLLRFVHWCEDFHGLPCELRYFRNVDRKEVDFVVLKKRKPWFCVEVKSRHQDPSPTFKYLTSRVEIPLAFQIHYEGQQDYLAPSPTATRVRVMPVWKFLACLP